MLVLRNCSNRKKVNKMAYEEKDFTQEKIDSSLWIKVIKMLGENRKNLVYLSIFMLMQASIDVILPLLNTYAINHFVANPTLKKVELTIFVIAYIALLLWQSFNVYHFFLQAGKIEMGFSYSLRKQAFEKLQMLSYSYYDVTSVGWIVARLTSDIARLAEIVSWSLTDVVWGIALMIGISIVMMVVNFKMACLVFIVLPFLAWVAMYLENESYWLIVLQGRLILRLQFNEGISGAKTSKTLVLEERLFSEFKDLTGGFKGEADSCSLV